MNTSGSPGNTWRTGLARRVLRYASVAAALATALLLLEACSDDTPTAPADADPPTVAAMGMNQGGTRIVVEPHWLTLDTIGVSGTLTATVIDAVGDTVRGARVSWASADTATVAVHSTGLVTAAAFGSTKVTAAYDSATATATVEVVLPLTDREILEIFFGATGGENWTDNTNWLTDKDLSEWHGVRMSRERVRGISLRENHLVGSIPPELGGLDELFSLYISGNELSGPVPAELSKLRGLRDLFVSRNQKIDGGLPPELGHMEGLQYLGVSETNLSGPVPRTFANLALVYFYFSNTKLCFPPALGDWLGSLQSGDEPTICTAQILIDPPSLYFGALGDTIRLSGTVVGAEGDTLQDATVAWSSADTSIATIDTAGLVTSVEYGTTEITATSGALSATADVEVVLTLSDRDILEILYGATGGAEWADTTNWLSDEPLSEWAGVRTNDEGRVDSLSLSGNNLTGSLPPELGELDDLIILDLSENALTGGIPSDLGALKQLRGLHLNDNAFKGKLPRALGFMTGLRYLHIGTNDFVGGVPGSFANLELDSFYAIGSGVCVPPSLQEWIGGIAQTDDPPQCVKHILIEAPPLTFYAVGETATLSANVVDAEGDTAYTVPAVWSSADIAVASVDAAGLVTATGPGSTEVTATYDSATAKIAVVVALPENDRDVLEILYHRARGDGWTERTNWLSDEPLSEWAGVETDAGGRVVGLSLSGNNLRGLIHASIGLLDQLVTLDLSRNWITGSIPAEIGDLTLLRDLLLSVNGLSGKLPSELGTLDSLRTFNVAATSLTGLVPASFADLELESFLINGTELCVPPSLTSWVDSIAQTDDPPGCVSRVSVEPSSLTFGAAGDTAQLTAIVIGPEGSPVESLAVTWDSGDSMIARVDTTGLVTARASGVTTVAATYDSVTVGAAEVAVRLPGSDRAVLETFYRATGGDDWKDNSNWLSDAPLGDWYGVRVDGDGLVKNLSLRNNNLTGQIPAAIGLLDSLFILDLSNNALTGPIPLSIGRLAGVRDLNLGRNEQLDGPLPPEMGNMTRLEFLNVSSTGLSGPLPETFSNLTVGRFYHSDTGLCVPRSLAAWYESLGNTEPLPCIPRTADRDVLATLYNATGGPEWQENRNWLSEGSLNTWGGIATDEEGYVTEIFMPWNNLTDSIPPELGDLSRLEVLSLYGNELIGTIPPELGKLTKVRDFSLSSNELEGPIPPEIGGMVSVDTMYLSGNNLSGPIPAEFGNLVNLEHLALFENELSGPLPAEFGKLKKLKSAWLVDNQFEGPLPPELGDMTSLEDLSLSRNKITGVIPPELGKLQALKDLGLSDNELTGVIPSQLGNLASLEGMFLMRNALSGGIPPELGKLSNLEWLWLFQNELTGPIPAELGNLSKLENMSIGDNEFTGSIPPELGQLSKLEDLHFGRSSLSGPIPPELGNLSSLTYLGLFSNNLSGAIPAELGNLSSLEYLGLSRNQLTGPIPAELGRLSTLESVNFYSNSLSGALPPELGRLASLVDMTFADNDLSGPLPPEIGELVNLESLNVSDNPDLEGLMPRTMLNLPLGYVDISDTWICPHLDDEFQEWLGRIERAYGLVCPATLTERFALSEFYAAAAGDSWTNNSGWDSDSVVSNWHGVTVSTDSLVRRLALPGNGLRGPLAPAIGNLRALETLDLASNSITGGIPVAMTSMDALDTIRVSSNTGMDGPLPFRMTDMKGLKALQYANTGLCASPSATFQAWVDGLDVLDGATCDNPEAVRLSLPVVYLTQAIQRPAGDVPLLSGRDALLRVFLVGDQASAFFEPEVVATLTREGQEVHRVLMRAVDDRLTTSADEGDIRTSYNAVIPAEHIVAGTDLVVVADSAEVVPHADGSRTRFPEAGSMPLNVIEVPPLELTVVPVLYADQPDSSIFEWTDGIADDSPEVGLFRHSFPFAEFSAKTRDSYVTSLNLTVEENTWPMVLELEKVYKAEEATGYWYAVADSDEGYVRGIARLNGWVSFGKPWASELAHEVGHTLDLEHAPCGGALRTDPDFPYANGSIGVWGYDFRDNTVVSPERRRDIMGYCYEKGWLSDYYFEKVIRVREEKEGEEAEARMAVAGPKGEMLVLWGGVLNGELRIQPVHSMYTTATLPERSGPYRIEGFARTGEVEFSLSFTPGEDVYGNKYFFFTIPIEGDWEESLERITLTGPEGEVTVDNSDPRSITVVTDPNTGRIRAILHDWEGPLPEVLGDTSGLEVESTRGILQATRLRR